MNRSFRNNNKVVVLREYCDDIPTRLNDILEYLYNIETLMSDNIQNRIKFARGQISWSPDNFIYTIDRDRLLSTNENLDAITKIIDDAKNTNSNLYAVVYDVVDDSKMSPILSNPRLHIPVLTPIPCKQLIFEHNKFIIIESSKPGYEIVDNSELIHFDNNEHVDPEYTGSFYSKYMCPSFTRDVPSDTFRPEGLYVLDEDVDKIQPTLDYINERMIKCCDCKKSFYLDDNYRQWFDDRKMPYPKRCKLCVDQRRHRVEETKHE